MAPENALDGSAVRLRLVGEFTAFRDGLRVDVGELGSRKARTLLKLLAVERGRLVPTDRIVDVLWGDQPPAQPGENVATLVSRLRKALGAAVVVGGRSGYRLADPPAAVVDVDDGDDLVIEAERRLASGEPTLAFAAAVRALDVLAAGRLLADEPYVAWAEQAEADRTSLVRRARHVAALAGVACDDAGAAVQFAAAAVADDPWDEAGHRLLMTAHARAGEPARALGAYTVLRELLDRELGVEPAAATRDLYVAILREDAGGADSIGPATIGPPIEGRGHQPAADSGPRLTGREAEMAQLNAAWASAADGRPQLVLLVGEAGIGKTRLAAEVAVVAAGTGGVVLHARCYEAERGLFLQPVVEALGPALGSLAAGELRRVAGESAAALAVLIPSLDPLLRPEPIAPGAPDLERRRAFDAVTDVIARLSGRGPVLLLLDDLQNAGRATVELLHYMTRRLGSSRVLALATIRREEGQEALAALDPVAAVIDVQALSSDAVAELAATHGQTHLAELIQSRTRGHTLFVIETLSALASGREGIPESLQAAVLARVHRTGRDTEVLLRAAAVLGATLEISHLAAMLDSSPRDVLERCEQALAARLLVVADRDFEFANDLVREVLYDSTPPPIRLAWHRQAADLLADHPESLAVHASAAHDWSRAARAWLLAAEEAMRRFAAADAELLLTRAIGAAVQAADVEVTARAHVVRGRAREARSEFDLAYADLHAAAGLAREAGDHRVEMIALRQLAGDVPVALGLSVAQSADYLERGLQLAEALGDRAAEVDLRARLAVISANRLRFTESLQQGRRAVAIARAVHDDRVLAAALDGLKTAFAYLGEVDELALVIDELEPLLGRQGDWFRLSWAVFESSFGAIAAARFDDAISLIEAAADIIRKVGYSSIQAWYDAHLGWIERLRGNHADALFYGRRAVGSANVAHPWWIVTAKTMLAVTLLEVGENAEAVALLEAARATADRDGAQAYLLLCLAPLAEATGSRETLDQADALLGQISAPAGSAWLWGADAYLAVARAWLAAGEPSRARAALAPLVVAASRTRWIVPLVAALLLDGRAAAKLGDADDAAAAFARAGELAAAHGLTRALDSLNHGA